MSNVRIGIPDLTGGISRQPPSLRFAQQVEECDNAMINFVRGLERRSGSEFVSLLSSAPNTGDIHVHWIEKSTTERFVAIFTNDATTPLRIYDLTGAAQTVNYVDAAAKTYITASSPSLNLRTVSIGDTTLVLNRTIVVSSTLAAVTGYTHGLTQVDDSSNAHNRSTWLEFDQPPTVANEYWYARESTVGHPYGWYKSNNATGTYPLYARQPSKAANSALLNTTMPIKIVWTGTQFNVSLISWTPRYVGDDVENPAPPFVGFRIRDILYHRDRLWFGGEGFIVGSQAGNYYAFFVNDPTNLTDSDPIFRNIPTTDLNTVVWLAPFRSAVIAACSSGAFFDLRADDALTPTTASLNFAFTSAPCSARPRLLNQRINYVSDYASGSRIYEYVYEDNALGGAILDVTNHCADYLPTDPKLLANTKNNEMLFVVFGFGSDIYVRSTYWQGSQQTQSAVHRWRFQDVDAIYGIWCFDQWLYVLLQRSGTHVRLERIDVSAPNIQETGDLFHVFLDSKKKITGTYSSVTNLTSFSLPFADDSLDTAYLGKDWAADDMEGLVLSGDVTGSTLTIAGDYSDHACWIGRKYETSVELSRQVVRDDKGSTIIGALQLKQMSLQLKDTSYVSVVVSPTERPSRTYEFTAKTIGTVTIGTPNKAELSQFNVPIMASAEGVTITISSDVPAPFQVTGAEFIATFVPARRSLTST